VLSFLLHIVPFPVHSSLLDKKQNNEGHQVNIGRYNLRTRISANSERQRIQYPEPPTEEYLHGKRDYFPYQRALGQPASEEHGGCLLEIHKVFNVLEPNYSTMNPLISKLFLTVAMGIHCLHALEGGARHNPRTNSFRERESEL
jgi:hypothetical protein